MIPITILDIRSLSLLRLDNNGKEIVMRPDIHHYLKEQLNVYWLRPESALWAAVASYEINLLDIDHVDIDLGSGNGIFSFITAGGRFSEKFDWFIQADTADKKKNVFDNFDPAKVRGGFIVHMPDIRYRIAFDKKKVMLDQAGTLGWYDEYIEGDIARPYPFEDESASVIFSNVLYWIPDPNPAMKEIQRVLKKGGRLILCLPDPAFLNFCPTYKSHLKEYKWLYALNRKRAGCMQRYYTFADIKELARAHDFKIIYHKMYLSGELLSFWDIGLRPLIRPLLKMTGFLTERERLEVKRDWVRQLIEDLSPMAKREVTANAPKGYHLCVLEKR